MDLVRRLRFNSIATSNLCQLIAVSFKLSLMKHVCLNLLFIGAADSIKQRFFFFFLTAIHLAIFHAHLHVFIVNQSNMRTLRNIAKVTMGNRFQIQFRVGHVFLT